MISEYFAGMSNKSETPGHYKNSFWPVSFQCQKFRGMILPPNHTTRSKVTALKRHLTALPIPCAWSYLRIGPLLGLSISRLLICVPHVKQADVKIRILGWSLGSWLTPSCSPSSCRFPRRSSWSSSSACPSGLWPTQCTRRTTACCTGGSRGY